MFSINYLQILSLKQKVKGNRQELHLLCSLSLATVGVQFRPITVAALCFDHVTVHEAIAIKLAAYFPSNRDLWICFPAYSAMPNLSRLASIVGHISIKDIIPELHWIKTMILNIYPPIILI
jgi:hypothetical protein